MSKKQIFGQVEDKPELVFVKPFEHYKLKKNAKTGFDFQFGRIHFNEEKGSITIFGSNDNEGQAIGVFLEHHKDAKFKDSKPDGVRFMGSLARFHGVVGSASEIAETHNESYTNGQILNVIKTDKGVLWTIKEAI